MRTERDMKIERIITALAAMITQCASSARPGAVAKQRTRRPT